MLLGGVLVKDYYLDLVDGVANSEESSKENTESDIEGFEQDLQSLLQVQVTLNIILYIYYPTGLKVMSFMSSNLIFLPWPYFFLFQPLDNVS